MSKTIVVIGALDTKGDQTEYLKNAIENRPPGHLPHIRFLHLLSYPTSSLLEVRNESN